MHSNRPPYPHPTPSSQLATLHNKHCSPSLSLHPCATRTTQRRHPLHIEAKVDKLALFGVLGPPGHGNIPVESRTQQLPTASYSAFTRRPVHNTAIPAGVPRAKPPLTHHTPNGGIGVGDDRVIKTEIYPNIGGTRAARQSGLRGLEILQQCGVVSPRGPVIRRYTPVCVCHLCGHSVNEAATGMGS